MTQRLRDRRQAGELLAGQLGQYRARADGLVLGLPRGGVPVAHAVAHALQLPLDIIVVRKLGVPGREEVAFGAISAGGVRVLNRSIIEVCSLDDELIAFVTAREERELARREQIYRGARHPCPVKERTVILVDDGIATGATVRAALAVLRRRRAKRIVVASPVIARDIRRELEREADEVVSVVSPADFHGVGEWYEDFSQTSDQEVLNLLDPVPPQDTRMISDHDRQGLRSITPLSALACRSKPETLRPQNQ